MVRVCTDTLKAKGKNKAGFYMDDILKENLDALIKNIKNDWDFCIIISGGGRVRIGKSVLALQIGYYWTDQLKKVHNIEVPFNLENNIVFKGTKLIEKGNYLGENFHFSPLIYDEAGADLESLKVMRRATQDVKDFLRECGQYNLLTILVLPEYFDLPKGIALSRSDLLLDVFTIADNKGLFQRGFFNFYSRLNKKFLYLKGKKELNYKAHPYDFHGRYYNNYPIDEQEYRDSKQEALKHRELDRQADKWLLQRNILFEILIEDGYTQQEISDKLKLKGIIMSQRAVSYALEGRKGQNHNKIVYKNDEEGGEGED